MRSMNQRNHQIQCQRQKTSIISTDSGVFAETLPYYRQRDCSISTSSLVFQLLHNLSIQETVGYAISVLCACVTQICSAITEAVTHLVGLRHFPLTFGRHKFLHQLTFIHCCMNNHSDIANVNHGGRSGLFKASNSLPLGSAMKPNYEQFGLPTVAHQNGFSSTISIGVPTFDSRISNWV